MLGVLPTLVSATLGVLSCTVAGSNGIHFSNDLGNLVPPHLATTGLFSSSNALFSILFCNLIRRDGAAAYNTDCICALFFSRG
jgi:hypothetical protein